MDNITTLISTLGFPIVACIALFIANYKNSEKQNERLDRQDERIDKLTTEMSQINDKLIDVVETNTRAISKNNDFLNDLLNKG